MTLKLAKKNVTLKQIKVSKEIFAKQRITDPENFGVFLVNMSAIYVVHYVAFPAQLPATDADWNNVKWAPITAIPQTCTVDYQTCENEQKYVLMATVNCGFNGYCLIGYQDTQDSQWYAAGFADIVDADCTQWSGTVYGLQ